METSLNEDIFYRRSMILVIGKRAMAILKRGLPTAIYNRVFDVASRVYRAILRALYFRQVLLYRLAGNQRGRLKTSTVHAVMPYSYVGASGLEATYDAAVAVEHQGIPGSLVECGVARGGSAALLGLVAARAGNRRHLWLFDSFEGLPEPTQDDYVDNATGKHFHDLGQGACLGTEDEVETLLFDRFSLDREKITLVKGWFENTVAPNADKVRPIAILRIDADWYESVKCCLENLYDGVTMGGYVIVDDYGSCYGAKKALDEFLAHRQLSVDLIPDGRGGVVFQKPEPATSV
jgi:O-methyltransferase